MCGMYVWWFEGVVFVYGWFLMDYFMFFVGKLTLEGYSLRCLDGVVMFFCCSFD
jgi:hypothetical protein